MCCIYPIKLNKETLIVFGINFWMDEGTSATVPTLKTQ
jgi:hypothetical protein